MRGPIGEVARDLSERARLIVLGCDDLSLGTAHLVGSTTVTVASHSACPVVAWRGDLLAPTDQEIVLGVDDTHASAAAVDAAFEIANRFGVGIAAVHTWSTRRPAGDVIIPYLIDWDALEAAEWQMLMHILEPWSERYPNVDVTYYVARTSRAARYYATRRMRSSSSSEAVAAAWSPALCWVPPV